MAGRRIQFGCYISFISRLTLILLINVEGFMYECSSNYECSPINRGYCCSSYGNRFCCSFRKYFYGICYYDSDCIDSKKPFCYDSTCVSQSQIDALSPLCNSSAQCVGQDYKNYCCDDTARCCSKYDYDSQNCYSDSGCKTQSKPFCCKELNKCCSEAEYDIINQPCNSSAECADHEYKNFCCDDTARCCSKYDYDSQNCYSDSGCKTHSKPVCCKDLNKCCSEAEYDIINQPCNSSAECTGNEDKNFCCDGTARCCSEYKYYSHSCFDNYGCKTSSKPFCCKGLSWNCCSRQQFNKKQEEENSARMKVQAVAIAATIGLTISMLTSLAGIIVGFYIICRSPRTNDADAHTLQQCGRTTTLIPIIAQSQSTGESGIFSNYTIPPTTPEIHLKLPTYQEAISTPRQPPPPAYSMLPGT